MATVTTKRAQDLGTHPFGRMASTLSVIRDPRSYYDKLSVRQGDPFRVDTFNGRVIMTASPEGAKQIFAASPEGYEPFAVGAISALTGPNSLLILNGARHKRERKLLRPPLHGARMRGFAESMADTARRAFGAFTQGEEFVALDVSTHVSLEIIARVIFGATEDEEVRDIMAAVDSLLGKMPAILMFDSRFHVAPLGLGPWATFTAKKARLDGLIEAIVARRRESGERGDDLLSMLLDATYEDGESMSYAEIHDEIITMLVAGHETTSIALAWALYHLHWNPKTLSALHSELDAAPEELAERARLPYLKAVCDETLRVTPVIPDIVRTLNAPMNLLGVEVPAGWCVGVAITSIHNDPAIYEEPGAFRPERFIERKYSPFEFIPFGGGHRRCIGAAFASFEIMTVLDAILSEYVFELCEPVELEPIRRNVMMGPKTGVRMRMVGPRGA